MSTLLIAEVSNFQQISASYDTTVLMISFSSHCSPATASAEPTTTPTMKPGASSRPSSPTVADVQQIIAVTAEGLELFAMAKAIPKLQTLDSKSFLLCFHLY